MGDRCKLIGRRDERVTCEVVGFRDDRALACHSVLTVSGWGRLSKSAKVIGRLSKRGLAWACRILRSNRLMKKDPSIGAVSVIPSNARRRQHRPRPRRR